MEGVTLMDIIRNEDSKVEELKSFLQSLSYLEGEINCDLLDETPLYAAIKSKKGVEFVEELIKHGADVNKKCRGSTPIENAYICLMNSGNKLYLSIMKLLLDNGANINEPIFFLPFEIHYHKYTQSISFRIEILSCIAEMILPHAHIDTLSKIAVSLLMHALQYDSSFHENCEILDSYNPHLQNILYQVIKLLLESGARISYTNFIMCIHCLILLAPEVNILFWQELLHIIVPHIIAKNIGKNYDILDYMASAEDSGTHMLMLGQTHPPIAKKLKLLKHIWTECLEESKNMHNVKLTNKRSVIETLQVLLCGSEEEKASVKSFTVYELMLRVAQANYPQFNDIMSQAIKTIDMRGVYNLVSSQHFGNDYAIHQDCFFIIAKYLSNDDIFNFLLALFPKTLKS